MVQSCHEPVLRLEWDCINAREIFIQMIMVQSSLHGRSYERSLSGISVYAPEIPVFTYRGIVAQKHAPRHLLKNRMLIYFYILSIEEEPSMRVVSDPCHIINGLGCDDRLHGHLVAGKRAGLIGAYYGHRSERLDCRKAPYYGLSPRHPLHSQGEGYGYDSWQALRYGCHGKAYSREKHLTRREPAYKKSKGKGSH